jgi:uncharacterized protein YcfJ
MIMHMNKQMLISTVAGIGIATAGGVAAYSLFGKQAGTASIVANQSASEQECRDEQVATVADPKDPHRIAGTAAGAVVGGAVGKDVGNSNLTTVVGAAAGALIGRKIQEKIQDNRADQRTTTTTERRCAPAGSAK